MHSLSDTLLSPKSRDLCDNQTDMRENCGTYCSGYWRPVFLPAIAFNATDPARKITAIVSDC
jgi:hypothetical protein